MTCQCSHTASFAVLMDVSRREVGAGRHGSPAPARVSRVPWGLWPSPRPAPQQALTQPNPFGQIREKGFQRARCEWETLGADGADRSLTLERGSCTWARLPRGAPSVK